MPNLFQRLGAGVKAAASAFGAMVFPRQSSWWYGGSRVNAQYTASVGDGRGNSIIMACAGWLMRTFPEAPLRLRKRNRDGQFEPVVMHDLLRLLRRPNPFYSGLLLWAVTVVDRMLTGNAYWLKIRSGAGIPVEIWWVPSTLMQPRWPESSDNRVFISHYEYNVNGHLYEVPPSEVVHFRYGLDPENTRKGLSPMGSLIREIFQDGGALDFMNSLLSNLGIPGVIISPGGDESIDQTEADAIKANFQQKFGGTHRGEPLVLAGKTDVKVLSFSPGQMDMSNLSDLPEERVTAVLGLPAVTVGLGAGLEHSIYNNMSESREAAYESHIIPTHRFMSEDIRNQLLPDFESDIDPWEVDFDTSEVRVLQPDQNALTDRINKMWLAGRITLNRSLTMQGLDEIGPQGDIYAVPINITLTPQDQLGVVAPPTPPTTPSPTPAKGLLDWPEHQVESKAADGWVTGMERLRTNLETAAQRDVQRFLTAQQSRVVDSLKEQKAALQDTLDWLAEDTRLTEALRPGYLRSLNGTVDLMGNYLGVEIEVDDATRRAFLQASGQKIGDINHTTRRAIQKALAEGQANGESVEELTARVQNLTQFGENRARLIARNEMAESSLEATKQAAVLSGVVSHYMVSDPDGNDGSFTGCSDRHGKVVTLAEGQSIRQLHVQCQVSLRPLTAAPKSANGNGHGEHKELVGV